MTKKRFEPVIVLLAAWSEPGVVLGSVQRWRHGCNRDDYSIWFLPHWVLVDGSWLVALRSRVGILTGVLVAADGGEVAVAGEVDYSGAPRSWTFATREEAECALALWKLRGAT